MINGLKKLLEDMQKRNDKAHEEWTSVERLEHRDDLQNFGFFLKCDFNTFVSRLEDIVDDYEAKSGN